VKRADMTEAEFRMELDERGWTAECGPLGDLGYIHIGGGLCACRYNGGKTRRGQLAYLVKSRKHWDKLGVGIANNTVKGGAA
jgi:hypothetical protein